MAKRKKKKWDGSTDSGSRYFHLRWQYGYSHDETVSEIEGTPQELYDKGFRHYEQGEVQRLNIQIGK